MSNKSAYKELKQRIKELEAEVKDLKKTEKACRKSEQMVHTVLCATTETMLLIDSKGNIININETASQRLNKSVEELIGMNVYDILPLDVGKERKARADKVIRLGKQIRFKDDRDGIMFENSIYPVFDERGKVVQLAIYGRDITDEMRVRDEMLKQTHDLGERVKELNCLYRISNLVEQRGVTLEVILKETANIIPPSWQYQEITCARIIMDGQIFQTENFIKTIWKQASNIIVDGKKTGTLEIYYLEEKPEIYEGPFLKEERSLLNAIAMQLGSIVGRLRSERALQESESRYKILAEQVADGVTLVQGGKCLFANDAFASMLGYLNSNRIVDREIVDHISGDFKQSFLKLHKALEEGSSDEHIFQGKCITKDGKEFWIEGHLNVIKWEGKSAVLSTIRDITKSKLKEIEIQDESEHLRREIIKLRSSIKERYRFGNIIGKSSSMQEIYELILKAGASDANVIIYGESGTGKELVANAIHEMSNRSDKDFVPVNCGAIPEMLLEREFFGHVKGAFTGADSDAHGYLDLAHRGTLFLDEVGELLLNMQVKLLRAIDSGDYSPVGSNKTRKSDFRIFAATNRDLMNHVNKGLMREDFFYRINIIPISVPPLRDRREDIPLLIDHYLKKYNGNNSPPISGKIMDALYNFHWPGNVRQLQNVLHRYITLGKLDFIGTTASVSIKLDNVSDEKTAIEIRGFEDMVKNFEKKLILKALNRNQWHRERAASDLGLPRRTFFRKMKDFELTPARIVPYLAQS